jgi:tRNA 2-thiouridine synthesizing protein A
MSTKIISIDARGLSCPEPVMLAQNAILKGVFPIEVLVDTASARENIQRMAKHKGCQVLVQERNGDFILSLRKEA